MPSAASGASGSAFGFTERRYLCQVGDLHTHLVDHAGMEHLALEIERIAFLAGMSHCEEGRDLALAVVKDRLKVGKNFRFFTADKADDRGLNPDCVTAGIDGAVTAGFFYRVGNEFACMAGMGGGTDACRKEDNAGLLGRHRDPTGTLFCTGNRVCVLHRREGSQNGI